LQKSLVCATVVGLPVHHDRCQQFLSHVATLHEKRFSYHSPREKNSVHLASRYFWDYSRWNVPLHYSWTTCNFYYNVTPITNLIQARGGFGGGGYKQCVPPLNCITSLKLTMKSLNLEYHLTNEIDACTKDVTFCQG
jgi:hypothetical protein